MEWKLNKKWKNYAYSTAHFLRFETEKASESCSTSWLQIQSSLLLILLIFVMCADEIKQVFKDVKENGGNLT